MDDINLKKIIEDCGVVLYDTEVVANGEDKIYRIYIMQEGGVSLDKCSQVTKIISPILDLDPPVGGKYTLEVSSPGIERKLTKLEHFKYAIGENIKATIIKNSENLKIKGKLLSVEEKTIKIEDKKTKQEITFSMHDLIKAKTYYQW